MACTHDEVTRQKIKNGEPFLFDVDDVNNVGACSKACYMAIGWLLNKACSKSSVEAVVLKQTMPDGRTKEYAIEGTDGSEGLIFPWEQWRASRGMA